MSRPIRCLVDEHVAMAVVTGLRKRGIDAITIAETSLLGAEDETYLPSEWRKAA
jgi:hypothetical protein